VLALCALPAGETAVSEIVLAGPAVSTLAVLLALEVPWLPTPSERSSR
jgi:hypothetical protein